MLSKQFSKEAAIRINHNPDHIIEVRKLILQLLEKVVDDFAVAISESEVPPASCSTRCNHSPFQICWQFVDIGYEAWYRQRCWARSGRYRSPTLLFPLPRPVSLQVHMKLTAEVLAS